MKITFLNPPFLPKFSRSQRSPAVTKSGTLYYPMWLASAAALAESRGHQIDLIDAPAAGLTTGQTIARLADFAPGLVVVDTSTPSIYNDAHFCRLIADALADPFIVLVGTHVSALPEESLALEASVGAVAVGEYDETVAALAGALAAGEDPGSVAGLCTRREGIPSRTAARPPIEDLDSLPFVSPVYKRFLDPRHYFNPNALFPMVTITTSRGCPFRCSFCVYPQTLMGGKVRLRSVGNVLDELSWIVREIPGVKAIFFEDDTLTAVKRRCLELAEGMIARGIAVSWTANARADLDLATMKAMRKAGCRSLCVGFESGNQGLLDTIEKNMTVEKMEAFMAAARQAGILVHGCFMAGLPGETPETLGQTLALAKRLNPDTVQFYPVMVYPGTRAYDWYKERGLIATADFSKWLTHHGLHNTVIRTESLTSEEIVDFCDRARREFYLRPGYLLYKLRQTLSNRSEFKRNLKAARTFLKYLVKGSDIDRHPGPPAACGG